MKMKPCQQWVCDACGDLIEKPEDGYLQWLFDENLNRYEFIIVHHKTATSKEGDGCYLHASGRLGDVSLKSVVGSNGLSYLLSFLDVGTYLEPEYVGPRVQNIREVVEIIRRLHTPYYEEARQYWSDALDDDYFGGANEVSPYSEDSLRRLIKEYGR